MALTENGNGNGLVMPVTPMYGGYGNGMGGFGFGGDGAWLILFILLACGGGWGMNGFGGFGGFGAGLGIDFPWLLNGQQNIMNGVNSGFDNAALSNQLSAIQTAITTGFSNSEVANCNRAMDSMQTAYNNQIASLERSFASQTATTQGFTDLASQLANCCCENRLATANLGSDIAREACADRAAVSDGIRDIIANQTQGFQSILTQMCNDKIDAKNEKITELQTQLQMAQLAATQNEQTGIIQAGQRALANEVEQYIRPQINPAYIVPNPYACYYGNNGTYGCNGGF